MDDKRYAGKPCTEKLVGNQDPINSHGAQKAPTVISSRFQSICLRDSTVDFQECRSTMLTTPLADKYIVSFMYEPEARRRGHLLKCYKFWIY